MSATEPDWLVPLLACPACRGAVAVAGADLVCAACAARYGRAGAHWDLVPATLSAQLDGGGDDRAWERWRAAMDALEAWRARRAGAQRSDGADDDAVRALLASAGISAGTVLDIGAKDGARRALLAPTARYVGVDPRPAAVCAAPLVRAVGEALPIRDRSADAVLCLAAFDYLVEPSAAVAEMARVLRPGGALALLVSVVTPAVAHARGARGRASRFAGAVRAAREVGLAAGAGLLANALRAPAHLHYYTRAQCLALLGVRFELTAVREIPQSASVVLCVAARKKKTAQLKVL